MCACTPAPSASCNRLCWRCYPIPHSTTAALVLCIPHCFCLPFCPQALDLVIHTGARHNIRLGRSLADYHASFGSGQAGIEPYLQWVHQTYNLTGAQG